MNSAVFPLLAMSAAVAVAAGQGDAPRYQPASYARKPVFFHPQRMTNGEALIFLRINLDAKGRITHIEAMDRGFGSQNMVDSVLHDARSLQFNPASLDGKGVPARVIVPVRFMLGADGQWVQGMTPEFREELVKLEELLAKGDISGANAHASWVLKNKVRYGYEYAALNAELARALAAAGRSMKALEAAEEATRPTGPGFGRFEPHAQIRTIDPADYILPQDVVIPLLKARMQLADANGLPVNALKAFQQLAGLVRIAPEDPLAARAAGLAAKLDSNEPLVRKGTLDGGEWKHDLYRHSFALEHVQGEISSMLLECGGEDVGKEYSLGEKWSVPDGWDDCDVIVQGVPGTAFDLVEFAD